MDFKILYSLVLKNLLWVKLIEFVIKNSIRFGRILEKIQDEFVITWAEFSVEFERFWGRIWSNF